jgi:cytosine/adenosine deaminase-related metal-dependent hydrolase
VLLAPPGVSTGRYLWNEAAAGGAQALDRAIGAIAPGRRADFVILDPAHPALVGRSGDAVLDALVFAAASPCITDVVAGGTHVVRDGRHIAREHIVTEWQRTAERLASM